MTGSAAYKKILLINTFGIGDVLFSTVLVKILKQHFPSARVDFICNKRCYYILADNPDIDNVIVFEKDEFRQALKESKLGFAKKFFLFLRKVKHKKYDLAIDLSLGYQASLILMLLGVKKRVGFNYHSRGRFLTDKLDISGFNSKHVIEYYLDLLKLIGIDTSGDKTLELPISRELERWTDDFAQAKNLQGRVLVGIAPGGGKSWGEYAVYRRWGPQNFSYIAEMLSKKFPEASFVLLGSEEEAGLCIGIEKNLGTNCLNLCGALTLPQSIALIKRCRLLLCNDGGILHIAVSQGVSTLSIFGPVDDKVYGPYPRSDEHRVVAAEDVDCRPCYRNFKHRSCFSHDCLLKIDKDRVFNIAWDMLKSALAEKVSL